MPTRPRGGVLIAATVCLCCMCVKLLLLRFMLTWLSRRGLFYTDSCRAKCTVGISAGPGYPVCDWHNPLLFFVYCTVDYCCYACVLTQPERNPPLLSAYNVMLSSFVVLLCAAHSLFTFPLLPLLAI